MRFDHHLLVYETDVYNRFKDERIQPLTFQLVCLEMI